MDKIRINDLLEAGVHFGHQTRRRNPKMKPYIYGARHGVTIFDLTISMRKLAEACEFLRQVAVDGGGILFVGTKRQAQTVVRQAAEKTNMHYVVHRWLGGMLTNNRVISTRVKNLKELRQMAEDGSLDELPNKEASGKRREMHKLERTLGGIVNMRKLPAAMVVIDIMREDIAIREAKKCGIPVVALVDSNCNPDPVDYLVPGNDDALRSIKIIVQAMTAAIVEGLLETGREVNSEIEFVDDHELAEAAAEAAAEEEAAVVATEEAGAEPEDEPAATTAEEAAEESPAAAEESPAAVEESPAAVEESPAAAEDEAGQESGVETAAEAGAAEPAAASEADESDPARQETSA